MQAFIRKPFFWTFILSGIVIGTIFILTACTGPNSVKAQVLQSPVTTPAATSPTSADTGMNVTISVSKPANGSYLSLGEKATVTITLKDHSGGKLTKDDFATLGLYMYGPQETTKTVTAVKLLNATTDRTQPVHHYIDLLTNAGVQVNGNVLTYQLQPVSGEEAGTYSVGVRAVKKGPTTVNQAVLLADVQIKTATVEKQIVNKENCAPCHQVSSNGQFYMHHIDPTANNPYGSPSLDSVPVNSCKACHNNDGYAAYSGDINNPGGPTSVKTTDPIVRRVHGVHFGEGLTNTFDTDPVNGNFKDYTAVNFPADILNCTVCHADDRWKTEPSREACASCHDNTWFGDVANKPKNMTAHPGGPQPGDSQCITCHSPDSGTTGISVVHNSAVNLEYDKAVLTMSPPANGKFYVAGEKPVVTVVFKDISGNPVDHTKVDTLYSTANLYVYGPRPDAKPVLTTGARIGTTNSVASVSSTVAAAGTPKVWTFAAGDTFKIAINGGAPQVLTAPVGAQSPDQVAAWLKSNITGVNVSANATAGSVTIASTVKGDNSRLEIYNSPVTTKMGWKPGGLNIVENGQVKGQTTGVTMEPYVVIGTVSTISNNLRGTSDTAVTRTADKITYQLDNVAGLSPGTYMAYAYTNSAKVMTDNGFPRATLGLVTFQIGTTTVDKKIATNCTQCHGKTVQHLNESHVHPGLFDTDYCLACHDYGRNGTGDLFPQVGGNSTSGWAGYGAKPLSARVHGVHFGAYLTHPDWVYAGNPNQFSGVIFPQDVRNCSVCHTTDTSPAWKTTPNRLACSSCHDTASDLGHMTLNTQNSNPSDPYDPNRVETCTVCHGSGTEFAVDKVHNISNPYVPIYPRTPAK